MTESFEFKDLNFRTLMVFYIDDLRGHNFDGFGVFLVTWMTLVVALVTYEFETLMT